MQGFIRTVLIALLVAQLAGCGDSLTAEEYVARAEAFVTDGQYPEARIELRNAIKQNPSLGEARLLLGEAQLELGDNPAAVREFERALDLGVDNERLTLGVNRAKLRVGRHSEVLGDLAQRDDLSPELAVVLGEAWLSAGDIANAQACFEKAKDLAGGLSGLGAVAAHQGDYATARRYLADAVALDPRDSEAWLRKGNLAVGEGRFEEAESDYRAAMALPAGKSMGQFGLARAKLASGQFDDAAATIDAVLGYARGFPAAHYLSAVIRLQQEDLAGAEAALAETRKLAPDYPPADYLLATIKYQQDDRAAAEKSIRRFLEREPSDPSALKLLAALLVDRGDFEGAAALLTDVSSSTDDPQILAIYGSAQLRLGDPAVASAAFARAVELAPDMTQFRNQLALSLLSEGDMAAAEETLTAAVEVGGQQFESEYMLAMLHLQNQAWSDAEVVIERLAAANPDSPIPDQLRGTARQMQGATDGGEADFRQALMKDPSYLPAVQALALIEGRKGDNDGARKLYEDLLARDPENAVALTALGEMARRSGDIESAAAYFERAVAADPASVQSSLALARFLVAQRRIADATRVVGAALEHAPVQPDLLAMQAEFALARGDLATAGAAIALLQQHAARDPGNAMLQLAVGILQQRSGLTGPARASLERALEGDTEVATAARFALARLDLGERNAAAARKQLEALEANGAKGAEIELLRGDILLVEGRKEDAAALYRELMSQGVRDSFLRTAALQTSSGEAERAVSTLEGWLATHPDDEAARLLLANTLMQIEPGRAITHYERLVDTANAVVLNNLAWLYMEAEDERALPTARKALAAAPDSADVLDTAGWILLRAGNLEEALPLLRRSEELSPGNPSILYHLAIALRDSGDPVGARKHLEKALAAGDFPEAQAAEAALAGLGRS